jgi:hypothetical protein
LGTAVTERASTIRKAIGNRDVPMTPAEIAYGTDVNRIFDRVDQTLAVPNVGGRMAAFVVRGTCG